MANWTPEDILDACAVLLRTVPDIGVVITDRRCAEEDAEVIQVIEAEHAHVYGTPEPHGVSLILKRYAEVVTESGCENKVTLGIAVELFYPYQRRRPSGITSDKAVRLLIWAIAGVFRDSPNLGLDTRVTHLLLQTTDDLTIGALDGKGADAREMHFGPLGLEAQISVTV